MVDKKISFPLCGFNVGLKCTTTLSFLIHYKEKYSFLLFVLNIEPE